VTTGDKSWFFLSYPNNSARATLRDELPERVSPKIDTEKCLISVFWSANGIHSLLDVPKGSIYNTAFFCDQVIPSLVQGITSHGRRKTLQGFIIYFDRASPHNSRRSRECLRSYWATRLQHPAYSPDLAPNDFFLFGRLTEKLIGFDCRSREDLKSAIPSIFNEIGKETLVAVFLSWIERLKWVIRKEGWYYHKYTRDVKYWFKIGRETCRSRTFGPFYICC
jgi:histone-lysine N-methyltransferase SETMAR